MIVKTTKVSGRRVLRFESLDELLADVEYLAAQPTRQLGNWTFGQVLAHLAAVYEKSIDGTAYRPNWFVRFLIKTIGPLCKRWVLRRGLPAGIRPPSFMFREVAPPEHVTTEDGLRKFRNAIARLKSETQRDWEQCCGLFTREEWDQYHIRHAELHLSFIVPSSSSPTDSATNGLTAPNRESSNA